MAVEVEAGEEEDGIVVVVKSDRLGEAGAGT
jgi:hypothetical protein